MNVFITLNAAYVLKQNRIKILKSTNQPVLLAQNDFTAL